MDCLFFFFSLYLLFPCPRTCAPVSDNFLCGGQEGRGELRLSWEGISKTILEVLQSSSVGH